MNQPLAWSAGFEVDCQKAPIEKVHTKNEVDKSYGDERHDLLILIVRNPKESLIRHNGSKITFNFLTEQGSMTNPGMPKVYFENLMVYDSWNPNNRLLVYYEDLITKPKETLTQILLFLDESTEHLDYFMQKYTRTKKSNCNYINAIRENPKQREMIFCFILKRLMPNNAEKSMDGLSNCILNYGTSILKSDMRRKI